MTIAEFSSESKQRRQSSSLQSGVSLMTMIIAENLTKRYDNGVLAIDAINFAVKRGEVYCLLGASGAGKTTAIDLFLDFIKPTSGRAIINGVEAAKEPIEAKKYLSYSSADASLYDHFTARQNLDFFVKLSGARGLSKAGYYEALREVGLQESAFEKKVQSFSKGMQQKVDLAIAMIRDTPAILLDEPTSELDPKASAELLEVLDQLRSRNKAILISTQDIFRIWEIVDRVGVIKEGRKVLEQTRQELEQGDLKDLYLDYMRSPSKTGR
jgi:ABC-2 type transport system ATP-binding protein